MCRMGENFENCGLNFELKIGSVTKILITFRGLYFVCSHDGESGGSHITTITGRQAFSVPAARYQVYLHRLFGNA